MKKIILILLLLGLSFGASAQNNPTLAQIVTGGQGSFNALYSEIANLAQPQIVVGLGLYPYDGHWMQSAPSFFNAVTCDALMDRYKAMGFHTMDIIPWYTAMISSTEYQTWCAANSSKCTLIATDCPGGPHCNAVGFYDAVFTHAASIGITLRIQGPGNNSPDVMTIYGWTRGSVTETMYEKAFLGLEMAFVLRYQPTEIILIQEPRCGTFLNMGTKLSSADVVVFLTDAGPLIRAAKTGIRIGIVFTADSCGSLDVSPYDEGYVSAVVSLVDFIGMDYFANSCNQSGNAWQLQLDNELLPKYIVPAVAAGIQIYITQTQQPFWCPVTGDPFESNAYLGTADGIWSSQSLTGNFYGSWAGSFAHWLSAHGASGLSIWAPPVMWQPYDPTGAADNTSGGVWGATSMGYLHATDNFSPAGLWLSRNLATWPVVTIH